MMMILIKKEKNRFKSTVYNGKDIINATSTHYVPENQRQPVQESFAEVSK